MSLLYYMFQSILNTFGLGYFFGEKKNSNCHGWGVPPPPFAENSAKIINLYFQPSLNILRFYLEIRQCISDDISCLSSSFF